jgi:hypothetical protein
MSHEHPTKARTGDALSAALNGAPLLGPYRAVADACRGLFADLADDGSLVEELIAERQAERLDERRAERRARFAERHAEE